MSARFKLDHSGAVYERDFSGPDMPAWQRLGGEGFDPDQWAHLADSQVADWPDLVAVVDVDQLVAEIVAAASHDIEPILVHFDPPLRIAYEGKPGRWNVSVTIAPRGQAPRFVRVAGPKLLDALAELHAKVVGTDEPRDA